MSGTDPVSERNKRCGHELTTANTEPVHHFFCDPAEPVTGDLVIIKTESNNPLKGTEILIYRHGIYMIVPCTTIACIVEQFFVLLRQVEYA